jgi:hypothetical protein
MMMENVRRHPFVCGCFQFSQMPARQNVLLSAMAMASGCFAFWPLIAWTRRRELHDTHHTGNGLRNPGVHFGMQDDAFLGGRLVARADAHSGFVSAVYGNVQHVCWDIDVVA